ncbi:RNA 2',3'-cyclic phosphodiesterase [Sphingomonas aracearum]|uniref:RNA 2',3'-cyclic phosphodiesterase n=1 Tax=Sphingomonas aracearum TaxID=2283317 RepID=A0A369W349_9SPHN|nr:RNA 2',3'-cyclic phosphodiesterase [Sphingomonas aracearum]RDE06491.1 RNA 2',3'-cyclic phosphodiesterase [Sphingomonas aracearum]
MFRLFAALRPPPAVRDLLLATMEGPSNVRWQDDEQLHLTLRFIGEVDGRAAEDVAAAIDQVGGEAPVVSIRGVGAFDTALWAGVAPAEPVARLHRKVDHALVRCGLQPERRAFLPHITLARFPRSLRAAPEIVSWQARHAALASEPFRLSHLLLYQSFLTREGARYEPVGRWPLA